MKYENVSLYRRLSHKYRGGWSYMDPEEHISEATLISREGKEIEDEDGYSHYSGSGTIILMNSVPFEIACDAIRDTFRVNNCRHEHDCCGCLAIGVGDVRAIDTDMYEFDLHGSRNY